MAGSTPRRSRRGSRRVVSSWVLAAAAGAASAQICTAPLPTPGAATASTGSKFSLIEAQCPALAEPAQLRRAAQLDLYSSQRAPRRCQRGGRAGARGAGDAAGPGGRRAARPRRRARALARAGTDRRGARPRPRPAAAARHRARRVAPQPERGVAGRRARRDAGDAGHRAALRRRRPAALAARRRAPTCDASAALLRTLRTRYGDDLQPGAGRLQRRRRRGREARPRACRPIPRRRPTCATCWRSTAACGARSRSTPHGRAGRARGAGR